MKWRREHPYLSRIDNVFKNTLTNITNFSFLKPTRKYIGAKIKNIEYKPPPGWVRYGDLRRTSPINSHWGFNRGLPIDRYYIEKFLEKNSSHIKGRVLEIGDNTYTTRFGKDRVIKSDVLNLEGDNHPTTTITGDLSSASHIPTDTFDCIIFTQTLQIIYDFRSAIETLHRILKPGGVLLATLPGFSPLKDSNWNKYWYWSFTSVSTQMIFTEYFTTRNVEVRGCGNVLATMSFLHGLAAEELEINELEFHDPSFEMLLTVKAVK